MKAYQDRNHPGNKIRPHLHCLGCGKKGVITAWGKWCFDCNVKRMDGIGNFLESEVNRYRGADRGLKSMTDYTKEDIERAIKFAWQVLDQDRDFAPTVGGQLVKSLAEKLTSVQARAEKAEAALREIKTIAILADEDQADEALHDIIERINTILPAPSARAALKEQG